MVSQSKGFMQGCPRPARNACRATALFAMAMLLNACSSAQATASPPAAAVNPLLTAAVETLRAEQIRELQQRVADFGQLQRYRAQNAGLDAPAANGMQRVVFFGDSITEGWGEAGSASFFPGKGYINRGISGQTTAQMLLRFSQDVLALQPQVVVLLAGTNDIAGNTGPSSQAMIEANIEAMITLANAHGIAVVLSSVLPVSEYPWQPGIQPASKISALNTALRRQAAAHGSVYLDYHAAMRNAEGGLDPALAADGVHPTPAGYALMAPLAQKAIEAALMAQQRGRAE